ncbi:hypothetical protein DO71_5097 [Burkholderia pseudomallei]|nr:hypothetical protein DP57_4726 [Burkholderia pseudomallei]KGC88481.1 hypothetical protein DO71_5097 [Burkholderia pseudomallei]KGV20433.1 hypothetical protein X891_3161 [Burkholderia pseudomallei TSV 43]KGV43301.1 hypothetical protein X893_3761 [Burkholderia pseudomallei TSV 31]
MPAARGGRVIAAPPRRRHCHRHCRPRRLRRPCAARLDDAPARHWALPATDAPRGGVGRPLASRMAKAMHLRPAFACASLARIAGAARSSLSHGVAPSRRSSGPPPRPHDFGSASAEPAYPPPAARLRRNAIARVVRRAARCAAPAPAAVPPAAPARRQPAAISTEHAQRTTAAHASVRRGVAAHARHVRRATPPSRASSPSPSARTSPCIRRAPLLS